MLIRNIIWFCRALSWPIWVIWLAIALTYDSMFTGKLKFCQRICDRWNSVLGIIGGCALCFVISFVLNGSNVVLGFMVYFLSGVLLAHPKSIEFLSFKFGGFGIHQWGLILLGGFIGILLG